MHIPFSPPYIDDDIIKEVTGVLQSGWITTGIKTKELESEVAAYAGVQKALAVNSATSAMMLVLHWFGVGRGDEVIVPAYTYCATALAAMHIGATPVMIDAADDFNIDATKIAAAITSKTKAIITVDYGGWPCDYDSIYAALSSDAAKKNFSANGDVQQQLGRPLLLSDAAHALGAVYKNKPVGSLADITVFSLHAVKNVTSAEGGVICLNMPAPFDNANIYDVLRLWSLNGQTKDAYTKTITGGWQYDIVYPGFKMNMPDVLAALGLAQFKKYDVQLLRDRKRVFDCYNQLLQQHEWALLPPFSKDDCSCSCHLFPLRIKNASEEMRNEIIEIISSSGISVNVHFIPLPMLTIFKQRGYNIENFPVSYSLYQNEISLPIYPQLNNEQCAMVIDAVAEAVKKVLL